MVRTMSSSRRWPTSRFQPGIARMYCCTGASPSAFAICGLPPARSFGLPGMPLPLLRPRFVVGHRRFHERFEGVRVHLPTFLDVDRPSRAAFQAGVEQTCGILEGSTLGEGELHLVL